MSDPQSKLDSIRKMLDTHHQWPADFTFKFIVPASKTAEVHALFLGHSAISRRDEKPSANHKYVSVTIVAQIRSSDEALDVYARAAKIEGIVSL